VLSQFIQKIPATTSSSNEINAYEYWFDNNYAGKVLQTVSAQSQLQLLTSINSSSINDGLHVFHIRFKDIGNSWSSVSSNFFQKFGQSASVKNSITLYRYWFDTADSIMYNVKLASPINLYLLNTPLDLSKIYKGDHIIHFQFLDSLKKWSSVTSDSMYKFPIVDAMYTMSDSIICDSGTVHFTNKSSIDADKYKWVFDDGTTSTLINPSHHYNSYGTHPIKLIAIDTTKSVTDSLTLSIFVVHSPAIHLGSDTAVCPTGITLDATNPSSTYLWSNSLTTSSIHVNSQGNYSVLVTNQYGCIARDTIHININPIPNVHLGNDTAVCPTGITLVATNPSSTYLWSNSLTTSSIHVNSQGNYSVKVTNQYGCIARDTIHININPVPNVHLGNDTAVCPTGITLDATYPNSTYLWSNSLTTSSIHVNSQGNYSVKVTNQYGCFARDTIHVNINPAPVVNLGKDTTICTYNSIVLDAGSGFSYYAWNTGQSTEKITVNTTGYYAVEVLNSYGCSGIDTIHVLTDPCTGIKDISENGFVLVYPNPNSGNYFIKALSDFNEPAEMEITDLTGRLLLHKENIFLIKDEVIPIDNESYNDGTYLLYITSKSTRFIQKIVINH
jgi:PKD repeat protein